jgi:hypothetical protein
MSAKILSKWIANGAIESQHLSASAKQSVLESKLVGTRRGVLGFSATAAVSDTVTGQVTSASLDATPRLDLLTGEGIYTGSVASSVDAKKVLIRAAGTDNGITDDNSDEVYGVLTEAGGVFTLEYYNADGSAYSFGIGTNIDFYFVEVQDFHSLNSEAFLQQAITGVVDANQSVTLGGHLDGGNSKHDASEIDVEDVTGNYYVAGDLETVLDTLDAQIAINASNISTNAGAISTLQSDVSTHLDGGVSKHDGSEIDYERADVDKKNIQSASDDVEAALTDLDDAIGSLQNGVNYTVADATKVTNHFQSIDTKLGELSSEVAARQEFTLSSVDISNKYVDLANIPSTLNLVELFVVGGLKQRYGADFAIVTDGADNKRLTWDVNNAAVSNGMQDDLSAGDILEVVYTTG